MGRVEEEDERRGCGERRKREERKEGRGGGGGGLGLIKSHHHNSRAVKRHALYLRFFVFGHTLATPPGPNSTTRFCTYT